MSTPGQSIVLGRIAAAAALAMAWRGARAQGEPPPPDDGPVIIGENRGKYVWWDLRRFSAELEFYGEYHRDTLRVTGEPTQTVNDSLLRLETNLSFESYIGHKNLIDLIGNFKLGVQDHRIDSNLPGGDSHENPLVDFYDVEALILAEGPAPATVYSRRDETRTARAFSTTLTTDTTEHGAIVAIRSDVAPTRVQFFHRELSQTDSLLIDDSSTQDTFTLQSAIRLAERQRLEINYEFDHISETQGTTFHSTYDRHDGSVTHELAFGSDREHNLRSYARAYSQSGQFAQTDYRLDENLRLRHSDTLETQYNLSFDQQSYSGTDQQVITGEASLRHHLFDSLITTVRVGGTHLANPGLFESNEVYGSVLFDYTKKVPFGRVEASLGASVNHQVNSDRGGSTFIINEPHTFSDPFPVVLGHRNVTPASIVMTNLPLTYTFIQGSDYSVATFPDRTELSRILIGPNPPANGETVLVNYLIGPEPGSTIGTMSLSASLRYSIDEGYLAGLSPYLYYYRTSHTLSASDPTAFVLDDVQDVRYGAEYRIGDLSLLAEGRMHDSTVAPFDEYRLEARYARRFGRDASISLELASDQVAYRATGGSLGVNRALGRWNQRLSEHLDFSVYLEFRDSRDSFSGNVQGFEQALEARWHYGQTRAFITLRNGVLNGQGSNRLSQEVTVGVTRSF